MSKQLIGNYTFNVTNKTVTLTDYTTVRLDRLRLITNVTTNKILYSFADNSVSAATISGNVITLSVLQGGEATTDKLEIDYDSYIGDPYYGTQMAGAVYQSSDSNLSNGQTQALRVNNQGKLWIYANDTIQVLQNDQSGGGTISSASSGQQVSTAGLGSSIFQIQGTWTGTLQIQGTVDQYGGNGFWDNIASVIDVKTGKRVSGTITDTGSGSTRTIAVNGSGWQSIRIYSTAWTSGTAQIGYRSGAGSVEQLRSGQDVSANSMPVVLSSDQTTISTRLTTGLTPTTGTITTATSTVTLASLNGVGAVTVSMYGTYAAVNVTFEAYDSVNWVTVPAVLATSVLPTPTTTTGSQTNATVTYNVSPLLGFQQFRVRATAWTSGTANIIIIPSAQFVPTQQYVSGSVTSTLAAGSNIAGGVFLTPSTSSAGLTSYVNASTSALAVVKGSAGRLHRIIIQNPNTSVTWIQIFNAATTGAVTLGTTPALYSVPILASGVFEDFFDYSDTFSAGIVIAATTTATGSTAPTTPLYVSLGYV